MEYPKNSARETSQGMQYPAGIREKNAPELNGESIIPRESSSRETLDSLALGIPSAESSSLENPQDTSEFLRGLSKERKITKYDLLKRSTKKGLDVVSAVFTPLTYCRRRKTQVTKEILAKYGEQISKEQLERKVDGKLENETLFDRVAPFMVYGDAFLGICGLSICATGNEEIAMVGLAVSLVPASGVASALYELGRYLLHSSTQELQSERQKKLEEELRLHNQLVEKQKEISQFTKEHSGKK